MGVLRKLVKALLILIAVLVVGLVVLIWPVLGVNPLEGSADHLWDLVSNEVDFFIRFPGTRVIESEAAKRLMDRPGFERLADLRDQLADLTVKVARQVNPEIPLGLFQVDLEKDLLEREMAVAGTIRTDYSHLKPDNFLVLARVAWYGRFLSALKRGFVRDRIPDGDRIEVVSGLYLKVHLDDEAARALAAVRTVTGRAEEDNVVYLGRIKDVVLLSDRPDWIEAALRQRSQTLPANSYFLNEFQENALEGTSIEAFLQPNLTGNLLLHHGRQDLGGPLWGVRKIVPVSMAGDLIVQAMPHPDGMSLRLLDSPPPEGFARVRKVHLQNLYEQEKADLRLDLSEQGIGRFIPKQRTIGAMVLHANPSELLGLLMDFLPPDELRVIEDQVRGAGYHRGFEALLRDEILSFLGETHLLIVHRPPVFETADLTRFKDPESVWPPVPEGQFSFTLVSRLKDSALPDKLRQAIFKHLKFLGMNSLGPDASGRFFKAELIEEPGDLRLIKPAYGAAPGGARYFVFSTAWDAARDVFKAAEDPTQRLVTEPAVARTVAKLPRQGSLALLLRGGMLRLGLGDRIRRVADYRMGAELEAARIRQEFLDAGEKESDALEDKVKRAKELYIQGKYPEVREAYLASLAWLDSIDTIAAAVTLGIGPTKQIETHAYITLTRE